MTASAGIMAVFNAHNLFAAAGCLSPNKIADGDRLINELRLVTITPLNEMKRFYGKLTGLTIGQDKPGELTIQAGKTLVTFAKVEDESLPFYYFPGIKNRWKCPEYPYEIISTG